MSTAAWVLLAVVVLTFGVLMTLQRNRRRNDRLEARYGPEYHRLAEASSPSEVAREIRRREKRLALFHVRPLTDPERQRYATDWEQTQARFVDDPAGAVIEADRLVLELMTARGYPMAEFDQRVSDISVDHPYVVEHYRSAHGIALRHGERRATTEDLRQALVHYRALFSELLEERETHAGV